MNVLPVPSLLSPPVLAELQQADLISSDQCRKLDNSRGVVSVQKGKSSEVLKKTADVLKRHGFDKESTHLSGKETHSSMCLWGAVWSLVATSRTLVPWP